MWSECCVREVLGANRKWVSQAELMIWSQEMSTFQLKWVTQGLCWLEAEVLYISDTQARANTVIVNEVKAQQVKHLFPFLFLCQLPPSIRPCLMWSKRPPSRVHSTQQQLQTATSPWSWRSTCRSSLSVRRGITLCDITVSWWTCCTGAQQAALIHDSLSPSSS